MRRLEGYSLWLGHVGDVVNPPGIASAGILVVVDLALNETPPLLPRAQTYCRFPLIDGTGNPSWLLQLAIKTVASLLRTHTPALRLLRRGPQSLAVHRGGGRFPRTPVSARSSVEVCVAIRPGGRFTGPVVRNSHSVRYTRLLSSSYAHDHIFSSREVHTMKRTSITLLSAVFLLATGRSHAQVSGNANFGQAGGRGPAEQREHAKHVIANGDHPPSATSMFVEANILMNVRADQYVAVFAVGHEGETLAECARKMDATVKSFTDEIRALGIAGTDIFVDFIAQHKIYGFDVTGNIAKEKLVGFELKKNVSIRYTDPSRLDKLTSAAAQSQVFDLVKVDYIVNDLNKVQDKLTEEAARVLKQKTSRYQKLLGITLLPPMQIYVEKFAIHYPTELYDNDTAAESESMSNAGYRQNYTTQLARKNRTFYFNGLDADGFDDVITPAYNEPVVQCTLYLKVKYEVEQSKAK